MTLQHLTTSPDVHFADASIMMIDRDLEHLPVVDDGELVGLLSSEELLGAVDRDMTLSLV
jgi:CBS domain-containing protein